MRKEG